MTQAQQNIFEQAAKLKLRIQTGFGLIAVEDLYDLDLQHATKANLDNIAIALRNQLKKLDGADNDSFVKPSEVENEAALRLRLSFEIVKHVLNEKLAARDAAQKAASQAAVRQRAMAELARRQEASYANMSEEELQALAKGQ